MIVYEHYSQAEKTDSTVKLKSRLRWTPHLHSCFVDAVHQLGGAHKAKPKELLRIMRVKGITLYHLKSHLQKYRLGKYSIREWNNVSKKGSSRSLDFTTSLSFPQSHHDRSDEANNAEPETHKDVQALAHLQSEAETHLRICQEAERRYLNAAFRSACKILNDQYLCSAAADTEEVLEQNVMSFESASTTSPFYHPETFSIISSDIPLGLQLNGDSVTSYEDLSLSSEAWNKKEQILEEDPTETYLNLDNTITR